MYRRRKKPIDMSEKIFWTISWVLINIRITERWGKFNWISRKSQGDNWYWNSQILQPFVCLGSKLAIFSPFKSHALMGGYANGFIAYVIVLKFGSRRLSRSQSVSHMTPPFAAFSSPEPIASLRDLVIFSSHSCSGPRGFLWRYSMVVIHFQNSHHQ